MRLAGLSMPTLSPGLVAVLSWCVWSALGASDPQPPLAFNTTWQRRLQFWRISEVSWSPPDDAVYDQRWAPDACHCSHLCVADTRCAAADLVTAADGPSCRLAARRGAGTTLADVAFTAFVRLGRAELGERCLTDDECWQAHEGAGCVDGVCACSEPALTARGECTISDCTDLTALGVTTSGQHWLRLKDDAAAAAAVFCDMETDGGGWTVFQRRQDDPEQLDFYRDWQSYRDGFGDVSGQFWLGNELIYQLTSRRPQQLRIELEDFEGDRRYAKYGEFSLADEADNYRLNVGGFTGDAGDSLAYHNGSAFSTRDRDNDNKILEHCANSYKGAWWYHTCHASNLNGLYLRGATTEYAVSVIWKSFREHWYSLKFTEMKIRPILYRYVNNP